MRAATVKRWILSQRRWISVALIALGLCLILDHYLRFRHLDGSDLWGHDWLGLALTILGLTLAFIRDHNAASLEPADDSVLDLFFLRGKFLAPEKLEDHVSGRGNHY